MNESVIIYTRVSDPSQIDNNSLETQLKVCKKFAESKGYKVAKVFVEEGVSAKHTYNRPKLRDTLAYCTKKTNKVSVLLVYKIDRFSRNTEEGLAVISLLAKSGVEVVSATEPTSDDPMGRAMRSFMMTLGQLDNELKGVRVKDNMIAVFEKGLWPFKPPIGYKRQYKTKEENKNLPPIPHPQLEPIMAKMFHNAAQGIYNKSQLARMMNLEGFKEYYGKEATHKIVKMILEKTFYYGLMYARKWDMSAMGQHKPITDKFTWEKAYHRVVMKKQNYTFQDNELYPLKGYLRCEVCDHPMTTSPSQGRTKTYFYYECKQKECKNLRINTSIAHKEFSELLAGIQPSKRVLKIFNHLVFKEWDKVINFAKHEALTLEKKRQSLQAELRSIRKSKDDGTYTVDEAREEAEQIRQEIAVLDIERSEMKIQQYDAEIVKNFSEHFFGHLEALWHKLDYPKKHAFMEKVFVGGIYCTENGNIRTAKLSPSFELIQSMSEKKNKNVTLMHFLSNHF